MSLVVDGIWKAGVWATTVWAQDVWYEGERPESAPESAEDTTPGTWWYAYDREASYRKSSRKKQKSRDVKAEQVKDALDRKIAQELRAQERQAERFAELRRLSLLAAQHEIALQQELSQDALLAVQRAIKEGTFSALEKMEREIAKSREEELFLLQAASIILH